MTFYGYKRPDGRVGVRNHILILPASVCASDTTRIVASQVTGAVTFNNQNGCSQVGSDQQLTMDVMAGYAANPNVYGTVVISLGCENCQMDLVVKAIQERTNKPLKQVIIQEAGGTLKAIEQAVRYAKEMAAEASILQREEFPISELIIGTECGGSDPTSGLAANPLIGQLSDLLVQHNSTSVLSETTEFIGGEHLLAARAANKEVHDRIYEIVHRYEKALQLVGEEVREGNPSPGNKAGGLTTLEEKSLGCIHKGGHTPVNAVYDYAKQLNKEEGLVIMDTPGNDPSSVAAMEMCIRDRAGAGPLIGFFQLNSPQVIAQARVYLIIVGLGMFFSFLNQVLIAVINATGNSHTPFLAMCCGLGLNFVLDPVLIFGVGPVPRMEVAGAALATVMAQVVVFVLLVAYARQAWY